MFSFSTKDLLSAFGIDAEGKERDIRIRLHLLCRATAILSEFVSDKDDAVGREKLFAAIAFLSMARTRFGKGKIKEILDQCYKAVQSMEDEKTKDHMEIIHMSLGYFDGVKDYYRACLGITSDFENTKIIDQAR